MGDAPRSIPMPHCVKVILVQVKVAEFKSNFFSCGEHSMVNLYEFVMTRKDARLWRVPVDFGEDDTCVWFAGRKETLSIFSSLLIDRWGTVGQWWIPELGWLMITNVFTLVGAGSMTCLSTVD